MKLLIIILGIFFSIYVNTVVVKRHKSKTTGELITMAAQDHNVERTYLSCILKIESEYKYNVISKTQDHGIGQINVNTAVGFKMDVARLTYDQEYSIDRAAYVLAYYQWLKKSDEPTRWVCRYNVGPGPLNKGDRMINCMNYLEKFYKCTHSDLKDVL